MATFWRRLKNKTKIIYTYAYIFLHILALQSYSCVQNRCSEAMTATFVISRKAAIFKKIEYRAKRGEREVVKCRMERNVKRQSVTT